MPSGSGSCGLPILARDSNGGAVLVLKIAAGIVIGALLLFALFEFRVTARVDEPTFTDRSEDVCLLREAKNGVCPYP